MSVSYGVAGVNQAFRNPIRLSQGQQGLFDVMGEGLAPAAKVTAGDPTSMRQRGEDLINRGKTVEGQRLLEQAQTTEERQKKGRVDNIRKTYSAARAAGKEEQFVKTMAEAGYSDVIARIKDEELKREVARASGNAELNTYKAAEWEQRLYNANTPQGLQLEKELAREAGFGQTVDKFETQMNNRSMQEDLSKLKMKTAQDRQIIQRMKSLPVPRSEQEQNKMLERIKSDAPDYAGVYEDRLETVNQRRAEVDVWREEHINTEEPSEPTDEELEKAQTTREAWRNRKAVGGNKAYEWLADRMDKIWAMENLPDEAPKVTASTLSASENIINRWVDENTSMLWNDPNYDPTLMATSLAQKIAQGEDATTALQTVIAEEMNRLNSKKDGQKSEDDAVTDQLDKLLKELEK